VFRGSTGTTFLDALVGHLGRDMALEQGTGQNKTKKKKLGHTPLVFSHFLGKLEL